MTPTRRSGGTCVSKQHSKITTMRTLTLLALCLVFSLGLGSIYGQSLKDTLVLDYMVIDKTIDDMVREYGAENVLVVMDIDNTILTSDTDLGSDIWYQWQRGELDTKPAEDQKLSSDCLFGEAIGLLYELGTMSITDSLLPGYVESWQADGITVFALTSRSPNYRAATVRELRRNYINLGETELRYADGRELFLDTTLARDLSYFNGIMMTSGMNKGDMLSFILKISGRSFKAIIFVDDTRKNIDHVKANSAAYHCEEVVLFHYNKIIADRLAKNNNVVLTREQSDKMAEDWIILVNTLNAIFPERAVKVGVHAVKNA